MQPHLRLAFDRQELAVAPEVSRAGRDPLVREHAPDGGVVVDHLEGTEARLTDVQRRDRGLAAALAAAQTRDVAHGPSLLPAFTAGATASGESAAQAAQRGFGGSGTVRQLPVQASIQRSRFGPAGG